MIQETIVTTQNSAGETHIAPMGIHAAGDEFVILPFKPSVTLDIFWLIKAPLLITRMM